MTPDLTYRNYQLCPETGPVDPIIDLLAHSLGITNEHLDTFMRGFCPEGIRAVYMGDELVGGLGLITMAQWFGGRKIPMGGIAAVGIAPEARAIGAAQFLLQSTLEEMYSAGLHVSSLFPSTTHVYRSAGYERAGQRIHHLIDTGNIDAFKPVPGYRIEKASPSNSDQLKIIHALYDEYARLSNGPMDRPDHAWKRALEPDGGRSLVYIVHGPERPEGYISYTQRTYANPMLVLDHVTLSSGATRSMLAFLTGHRSTFKTFRMRGPLNDPLLLGMREQIREVEKLEDWMLRIVDVPQALEARGYPAAVRAKLDLAIDDPDLAHNHGNWIVDVEGGTAKVSPGGDGTIRLDRRGLAGLYSSHLGPYDLQTLGLIECADDHYPTLAAVFAGPQPHMCDMF